MTITYYELAERDGTDGWGTNSNQTRAWLVAGTDDEQAARAAAESEWNPDYNGLVIDSVDHEYVGPNLWKFTAHYIAPERADQEHTPPVDESRFSFDTTGTTAKMRVSYGTTSYAAPSKTAPDFKSAIAVSADGTVEGVDVITPGLSFSVTVKREAADITLAYIRTLYALTGKVNNASFFGFAAGTVLFLGASGSEGTDADPEVTYKFLVSPNVTGLTVGAITGIAKNGHQYLWVYHEQTEDSTAKALVTRPIAAYVETVYPSADFSGLGIS